MMKIIHGINLENSRLTERLYELQRAAYLVEANLIGFEDIPPLKESFEEFLNCGETFLGYFEREELAGAISYTIDGQELTICRMVVDPKHFRKGIAQKLLKAVEDAYNEISTFKVSTGKDNYPARNLYQKNGFELAEDVEVAPNFYISIFEKRKITK
jgi:ribosomal protein S18 acetylase RimI-like enzyme